MKSSIFFKGNILLITGKGFPWLYPFCSGSEYLSYSQSFTIDVLLKGHDGGKSGIPECLFIVDNAEKDAVFQFHIVSGLKNHFFDRVIDLPRKQHKKINIRIFSVIASRYRTKKLELHIMANFVIKLPFSS